jgi:ATP-dependent Clp protease ATP-binding subunit ClpC
VLARTVEGQDVALGQVARAVSTHLAKPSPARPESLLFVGPTGTGKTSTVEALPDALEELGFSNAHVFRVDCGELQCWSDLRRIFGAPPSYVGYVDRPPLVDSLGKPGCILLLDEIEKAHSAIHDVFLALLDTGRLTAPDGETIEAPRAVVVMTTNLGAGDLAYRLRELSPGSREEQRACREHLLREGWPPELVGRIGTIAVFDELGHDSRRGVADRAIHSLAGEFGLVVDDLPGVLLDVVCDIADASEIGARAYTYAARDLLVDAFADAARAGLVGRVAVDPGPPPQVVQTSPS